MKFRYHVRNKWWRIKRAILKLKQGDMFATYGRGKYVDVTRTLDGRIIIRQHHDAPLAPAGTILLIPYQPNHGVMVEIIDKSGIRKSRDVLDYGMLYETFARKFNQSEGVNSMDKSTYWRAWLY